MPRLVDAFRTGGGVGWTGVRHRHDRGAGRLQPAVARRLVRAREILPAMPDIHALLSPTRRRVSPTSRAASAGRRSRSRAAYPNVVVDGFDIDAASIELANRNAREAGVDDRVTFAVRDAADAAAAGQYDLAVIIEAVHDMTQPVERPGLGPRHAAAGRRAARRRREDRGCLHRARAASSSGCSTGSAS